MSYGCVFQKEDSEGVTGATRASACTWRCYSPASVRPWASAVQAVCVSAECIFLGGPHGKELGERAVKHSLHARLKLFSASACVRPNISPHIVRS